MAQCPNPKCMDGEVWQRGTTGPTGDDPSDWQTCPTCLGSPEAYEEWRKGGLARGFCRTCGQFHAVALHPNGDGKPRAICYACYFRQHHGLFPGKSTVALPI